MAFDGMITKKVVTELNTVLIDGKINRVFEPTKNELILGIYSGGKNYALQICIDSQNCRIHLTTSSKPNPYVAPNFCMLLRKHLIGYRICKIEMDDLERIVTFTLEGFDELKDRTEKKLVVELMGKHSNVILLNANDIIIDSLRHLDVLSHASRDILPAHPYTMPISNKESFLSVTSFDEFYKIIEKEIEKGKQFDKIIADNYAGISKVQVQFLCDSKDLLKKDFDTKQILKILYTDLKSLVEQDTIKNTSCQMITNRKGNRDYSLVPTKLPSIPLEVNFFLDDFYHQKEQDEFFTAYRNQLLKWILTHLKKYQTRLLHIEEKLQECNQRDIYQLYGELITANLYRIANENKESIILENYYEENKEIQIPLDPSVSIATNAKKYFKKYNKLKNALEIVNLQKKEAKQELDYLESIIYEIENCKTTEELNEIYSEMNETLSLKQMPSKSKGKNQPKKKKAKTQENFSPMEYYFGNYQVFVGKNNKQNDYLTTKYAHNNDLWFHTKEIHGSHVILKTNGQQEIPQEMLIACARLAAYYSKAKLSDHVPVDYCFVRYVKKPNGSKPGMVIYTNNKTLYVSPDAQKDSLR